MLTRKYKKNAPAFKYKQHIDLRNRRTLLLVLILVLTCLIASISISGCKDNEEPTTNEISVEPATPLPEKEYNIPPADEENDLLKIATSAIGTDEKICYLTFDDGPTKEVTPRVLDVLDEYNVKATFFVLGKMLDANRDIAERVHSEGHLIANHSYNHVYESLYESSTSFMDEINKTQELITDITGDNTLKLIRFPGGGHNAGSFAEQKQEYKQVLKQNGYYFVDWNCLNGDAEAALRSADELLARVKNTAVGKNIVVLMHDAAAKTTTPDALGNIIEYLRSQGYEFKRLDEVEYYYTGKSEPDTNSLIL